MLVVGGIHPKGEALQPTDTTGCDTSQMFTQGLGMFSLNNHTWSSNYDPFEVSAAYQVHPSISKVIGGTQNGGATAQTPVGGFSQQALGTLLGAHESSNKTSQVSPGPENVSNGKKRISKAVIAGISVAGCICVFLVLLAIIYLTRLRHRQRVPPRPVISLPIGPLRKASELTGSTVISPVSEPFEPVELSAGKVHAHELSIAEKPLPPKPREVMAGEVQEMEGELGWHPAVRNEMKQRERRKR